MPRNGQRRASRSPPASPISPIPPRCATALRDATSVVSTAHARHAAAVIAAAPPDARLIFLGSTRKFTRWPDAHGNGVLAGEAAFLASGRTGVMLHPTMIYGAAGEDNVRRLAALLRRLPVLPLPGGGNALVQPIHQDDVTRAIRAALALRWDGPHSSWWPAPPRCVTPISSAPLPPPPDCRRRASSAFPSRR